MWSKIDAIIGLVIGMLLIVFGKNYVRSLLKIQLKKAKPEQKEQHEQLKEMGYDKLLYNIYMIAAIIAGIFFVVTSVLELIGN